MDTDPEQLDIEDDLTPDRRERLPKMDEKPKKPKAPAKPKPATRAQIKLVDAAVEIGMERPRPDDAAYMARELVQCTLPHRNPGDVPLWKRTNGNLTLGIQPGMNMRTGESYGYPFGTIPRLLLFWVTTEAVKTKSRRLELSNSLAGFMRELGLVPNRGGPRSDARRLREQMDRLFQARISFQREITRAVKVKGGSIQQQHGQAWLNMEVAPRGELWWDAKDPEQPALWGSWIELGEDFYRAITAAPVPVDMRALKALKRSPLALDLYAWLTHEAYRAHKSGQGRFVAWSLLMEQHGAEYSDPKDFGKKARAALRKVQVVYPDLKLGSLRAGVRIEPWSFPAIQPRPGVTIDGTCTPDD